MKIYEELDKQGRLHSFEVPNWKLSRVRATKIVSEIPGVIITRKPKRFLSWFREDCFCEFELNNVNLQIDEPFGDNSRFWITKYEGGWCKELELVMKAFQSAW